MRLLILNVKIVYFVTLWGIESSELILFVIEEFKDYLFRILSNLGNFVVIEGLENFLSGWL